MIRRLMKSIREFKLYSILAPLLITGEVICETVIPIKMAALIDEGIDKGDMQTVYMISIQLVIIALFSLIFGMTSGISAAKASSGFSKNLRKDLFYRIQKFSFKNIDKFSTASLITRTTTDVTYVRMAFQMIIRIAVRAPLMLCIALIFAFSINKKLALIFLIAIPIMAIGLLIIFKVTYPQMIKVFDTYDELNNVVEENVSGIRVVKSYVLEDAEKKKFKDVSNRIYMGLTRAEKILNLNAPIMQFAIYLCMILISWFGAKTIITSNGEELSTGELMTLFTYTMQILTSLMMLSMIVVMVAISRASAKRIVEVLEEEPDIKNPNHPIMKVEDGSIEYENVSFSYVNDKDKECLKNINLKIASGEKIGIIGGTGSGKSSLVNLISRLYDVTQGNLLVGGENVRDYDLTTLRNAVSVVLQKNVLFSGTIEENIKWGDENASHDDVVKVCKLAQAEEFIEKMPMKYDTKIEQGGTNVSGGQKQRLCIARALLKKPKILVLDDSTSAVDTKTDKEIQKAFKEEIPDVTKIIIAQRITSVEDCDRIIVMDDGKIDDIGTHEELLKNNKIYQEVYNSQLNGMEG